MTRHSYDALVIFRAEQGLVERAGRKARREGVSLSEIMRRAVRRELEVA